MADTQRTRAALLVLLADNVTGQISAQDFRDVLVTIMEEEFANPGDFWKKPVCQFTTTDADARGDILYSQTVGSDCSAFNVMYLNTSNTWMRANVSDSTENGYLGLAMDSYTSDTATAQILKMGLVYYSAWSTTFSDCVGRPVYLDSGVPGSISLGLTGNSFFIIGFVVASEAGESSIGKFFFDPEWAIRGQ